MGELEQKIQCVTKKVESLEGAIVQTRRNIASMEAEWDRLKRYLAQLEEAARIAAGPENAPQEGVQDVRNTD